MDDVGGGGGRGGAGGAGRGGGGGGGGRGGGEGGAAGAGGAAGGGTGRRGGGRVRGAVRASRSTLDVPVTAAQRNQSAQSGQSVSSWVVNRAGLPRDAAFTRGVRLAKDSDAAIAAEAKAAPVGPYGSDTGELTFDKD